MKPLGKLLLLVVVVLLAAKFGTIPEDHSAPKTAPPDDQILDPSVRDTIGKMIKANGFNCPAAKLVYKEGPDAFGNVLKVWCGPAETKAIYEKAVFRVTFRPDGDLPSVRPYD